MKMLLKNGMVLEHGHLPDAEHTATRQLGRELVDFEALKAAGAFAFTDDGVGVQNADMMLQAMKEGARVDMPIVAHTEENTLIHGGAIHEGRTSEKLGIQGIPSVTESVHIARDVLLAEAAGCHYHVCHVSTKESVRVIRDAKRAGIRVTAEFTLQQLVTSSQTCLYGSDHHVHLQIFVPQRRPTMPKREDIKTILVIGSGPIIIGQAAEFDYAGTQACLALKEEGYR